MANKQTRELRKLSAAAPGGVHSNNFATRVTSSSCGTRHTVNIVNMSHSYRAFSYTGNLNKAVARTSFKKRHQH